MKTQINEIKRMQELAGILKESEIMAIFEPEDKSISRYNTRVKFEKAGNVIKINLPDEKHFAGVAEIKDLERFFEKDPPGFSMSLPKESGPQKGFLRFDKSMAQQLLRNLKNI